MADKQCERCGELSPADASFCSNCGNSSFREVPPGLARRLQTTAAVSDEVHLDTGRLILLSVLSSGLYFYYWAYLTWKHLASETGDVHYPVWHTMSFSVPIYGLFRLHRHVSAIRDLAEGAGVWTGLGAGIVVVLFTIASALDFQAGFRVSNTGVILTLAVISVVLTTTIMFRSQRSLNDYWAKTRGASVRTARMGAGGVVIVIVGMLAWLGYLVPE